MAGASTKTTTTNGVRPATAGPGPSRPRPAEGVRHPVRVAVGAVLVVVCALAGALVLVGVNKRSPVLIFARTVEPGQTITAADLGQAQVSAAGVSTMSPSQRYVVIGRVASGRLPAGSAVAAGELNPSGAPDPNSVELPVSLKPGTFPPSLVVGDTVLVVPTPPSGSASTTGSASSSSTSGAQGVPGRVASVQNQASLGSSASTTVTVSVPKVYLSVLAAASSAGQIILAKASTP